MSLITRCPACGTMFKVVPDQLKISEGWVRCGHCAEVFDARSNFFDLDEQPQPQPQTLPQSPSQPFAEETPAPQADVWQQPDSSHEFRADEFTQEHAVEPAIAEPLIEPEFVQPVHEQPLQPVVDASAEPDISIHSDFVHVGNDLHLDEPAPQPPVVAPATRRDLDADDEDDEDAPHPAPTPSFVKQADRRAFWRRPVVRGVLVVLFLVLSFGLTAQLAYLEHDRIAAQWPVTKPVLEKMCDVMGCRVGPLRKIDAVVIDGSSFTRMRADAYRLSIVLKNNASTDVAMPSVELTLTDTQDEAVVRRVLSPADMGAGASLAAGAEWNGNVPISVAAGGAVRVAGYRVLAFYP